jgi:LEA14-like dessication related protein
MQRRLFFISLAVLFSLVGTGCSSLFGTLEKPKVNLKHVYPKDSTMTGTTLVFVLDVENPNNKDLKVESVAYKVFISGKELGHGSIDKQIVVPAKKSAELSVPLPVKYQDILNNLGDILLAREVPYKIEGNAKISYFNIPFTKEGKVELR